MLVRTILEKYPNRAFHMMTPGGYVDLPPEQAKGLLNGEGVKAHPGTVGHDMGVEAEELLNEKVHSISWKDGAFYMMTDYLKDGEEQGEEPEGLREMEEAMENVGTLQGRLEAAYGDYIRQLRQKPAEELIEMAEEIAATKLVYEELAVNGTFGEYADYLLQFENPLEVLRDSWQTSEGYDRHEEIDHMLWDMKDRGIGIGDYPMAEQAGETARSQGVVMC